MRKSAQQRISETEGAILQWSQMGLNGDRRVQFMRDALTRMQGGKSLSAKQRDWLDALISEGPPVPAGDPALVSRIERLKVHLDARGQSALESLRFTIVSGRTLSEKQQAFLESLLSEAQKIETHGRWAPPPDLKRRADFAHAVVTSRSGVWKANHPGTMGAAERYSQWLERPTQCHIDERTVEKILSACAPALREFDSPKFQEGDLVWLTSSWTEDYNCAGQPIRSAAYTTFPVGSMALVVGPPAAVSGDIGYPVIIGGSSPIVVNSKILTRNQSRARQTP